jgi:hypothetical protein
MIPSNSLAAVYGIAADCAERQVLGPDNAIDIEAIDETHTRVNVPDLLKRFHNHGNFGFAFRRCPSPTLSPMAISYIRIWPAEKSLLPATLNMSVRHRHERAVVSWLR